MKIGIIGAGFVGESLAHGLTKAGHSVMLSSRTPDSDKMQALIADIGDAASVGIPQATVDFSEVVALAVPTDAVDNFVQNVDGLSDKIILDMTQGDSESIAQITGARVVKIFNMVGAEHYQNPQFGDQAATMLYCGDAADAKQTAAQLASDLGFDAIDFGELAAYPHLVNLAYAWIHLAFRAGQGRDIAFKVLKR